MTSICRARSLRPLTLCKRAAVIAAALIVLLSTSAPALEVQGHRGARGLWPENTLAGFEAALRIGVDVLELDVGLSRDGVVIVSHNPRLSPDLTRDAQGKWLSGEGPLIRHSSAEELRAYDVGRLRPGSRAAARFTEQVAVDGQRLPKLREVFELADRLGAAHVRFNIELKLRPAPADWFADPDTFARAVVGEVEAARMHDRVTIQAFDWRALVATRRVAPGLPLAALTVEQSWLDNLARGQAGASAWTAGLDLDAYGGSVPRLVHALGAGIWSPYWREVTADSLAQAHGLGLTVSVWTVNKMADIEAMVDLGVDSIISDFPDRVRSVLAQRALTVPPRIAAR